ncbi:MAG: prephenate dehydratase [Zoogloeaceae bacterium]|jgi:chorismate mutase/prephenate dehydratase|nr:prephenate dehydratase [Zoogloeaceae bacterium]
MTEGLSGLRAQIDAIDDQILELLNRRAKVAQAVGETKRAQGMTGPAFRPEREAQVLRRVADQNPGPLPARTVAFFFREIMSACLALETPLAIAYLGPEGTFSEAAAMKQFGHAANLLPQASIDDVFRAVEAGHADFAVVPVENSSEGAVGRTLDLLVSTSLVVCGEVLVRIHQNLLSRTEDLAQVEKVYAHAQSLAQCHEWLNRHLPGASRLPVASNAHAAQLAAGDPGAAAIASLAASERYQLPVRFANIEDDPENTTRFVALGKQRVAPSGHDKTSLILSAPNVSGSLYELLAPLAEAGVSMTRLESRPARQGGLWEYVYFVDLEGHENDAAVQKALSGLKQKSAWLKSLGSYPVGGEGQP